MSTKITRQFVEILKREGWDPTEKAVEKIVKKSLKNKSWLRKMLSKHSNWDKETMRVTFPITDSYGRLDVQEKMDKFMEMCHEVDGIGNIETLPLFIFREVLERGGPLTKSDCAVLEARNYTGGKAGQKIGRAINAWAVSHGINEHKDYNWRFNELINGGSNTADRVAFLSVNPIDFLLASHGNFNSCHSINREENCCHQNGNLSYALDEVTMVFFTIAPGSTADYPTERIDRVNYHWDCGLLIQGRLYTSANGNHALSRAMVCKAIADCMNVPNLWIKHSNIDQERIDSVGSHYPDYEKNEAECNMLTLQGAEPMMRNLCIGHDVYCISCGEEYCGTKLDCCSYRSCAHCGEGIDDDYVELNGSYYCTYCVSYCDHCQEYYFCTEVRFIESTQEHVCDTCLSEDFIGCERCADYVLGSDAEEYDNEYYCSYCFDRKFIECRRCGDFFEINGSGRLCPACIEECEESVHEDSEYTASEYTQEMATV